MRLSSRFAILCTTMCFAVTLTPRRVGSGKWRRGLPILLLFLLLPACGRRNPSPSPVRASSIPSEGSYEVGIASWYGPGFDGRTTANGEAYDMYAMTAAHKRLPFDTWVRVVNLDNRESTVVRINDRGPFIDGRVIDLSHSAAEDISMVGPGTARVQLLIVDEPMRQPAAGLTNSTPGVRTAEGPRTQRQTHSGDGRPFQVQVGAFRSRANARRLKARLAAQFPDVGISETTRSEGTLFRVRLGRFGSVKAALEFRELLLQEGLVHEAVVMRNGS